MPIEIRELSVKVNVREENSTTASRRQHRGTSQQKSKIIDECLEQVAEMFKNKKER